MVSVTQLAEHTGLSHERINQIAESNGLELRKLTINRARHEVIRILRAGASGTLKREDVEKEHARLLQAKRIKTDEQIKTIKREIGGGQKIKLDGFLIDDDNSSAGKKANHRFKELTHSLRYLIHENNDTGCSDSNCPYPQYTHEEWITQVKDKPIPENKQSEKEQ